MKRPLAWMLLFLALGIACGRFAGSVLAAALFTALFAALAFVLFKATRQAVAAICLAFALLGFASVQNALAEAPAVSAALAGQETEQTTRLSGRVVSVSVSRRGYASGLLRADMNGTELLVLVRFPLNVIPAEGQTVAVTGNLTRLSPARNPGAFDELLYWRARHAEAKLYADEAVLGEVEVSVASVLYSFRVRMTDAFYAMLPEREAGVLNAMITGDRAGIDDEIDTLYRDAGIYHIIAVSGTHMTILAMAVQAVLGRLGISRRRSCGVAFTAVALYCVFTGASAPAVRAVLMYGVIAFAPLVRRDADTASAACFAAVVLLLYSPLYLWDVGFLYSFTAVFALCLGTPAVERGMNRLLRRKHTPLWLVRLFRRDWLRLAVAATVAVFLLTWPLTAWYFYSVSFISVLANLVILPTVTLLTVSGFLAGLVGMLSVTIGSFFAGAAYVILRFYENLCRAAASVPFGNVLTGRPPLWLLALYAGAAVLLGFAMYAPNAAVFTRRRRIGLAALGLWVISGIAFTLAPKPLVVAMLDVGQGDAIVLSRGSRAVVWDGGGNPLREIGDNTGVWTVIPYLRYLGAGKADAVLTHADGDHAIGVLEAIHRGIVRRVYLPDGLLPDEYLAAYLLESAALNHTEVAYVRAGDKVAILPEVTAHILYPDANGGAAGNDGSVVARVDYGAVRFLLTGDAEMTAEAVLLTRDAAALHADVLKLAHHGSGTSSVEAFLRAVSPSIAAASAGRNNRYGHPSPAVLERLDALGIPFACTAERGAILFTTDGKKLSVQYMLEDSE